MGSEVILIERGCVVTVDDAMTIHDPGWVLLDGDTIVDLGPGDTPASARRSATSTIDADGCAVMPGMVNSHTHLFQTFFRGLGDDKRLLDWLRDYIWPGAENLTARDLELAASLGIVENLRSGVTSVLDHQYVHADPASDDAACGAAERLGVRYYLARGWADRNYPARLQETVEQISERGQTLSTTWHGAANGRIRVQHAPLIPWGCSDDAMRALGAQSAAWGGGLHTHCGETREELTLSLDERNMRHVPWLASVGALGPSTQLAHSVWLDDDELGLIAKSGATVAHCPVSNMYLASGVARIPEMLAMGIPVGLASDGPGSNNRQDLFEAMKVSVLLQKVHTLDPMILQPEDALRMACRGGAATFGMPDTIGVLEPGRKADVVIVDLRSVFLAPVHRVISALVFNASPRDVRDVIVDGEIVIRDRLVLSVDEQQLLADAGEAARALFRRSGIASRVSR
jgi:5-methylthioadenosine/S-adenosylhomocysteine deaminase